MKLTPDLYGPRIIAYLRERHLGAANAVKVYKVAAASLIPAERDPSYPQTRELIRELVMAGADIGSGEDGFYWIDTLTEYDNNIKALESRAEAIQVRANAMRRNKERMAERKRAEYGLFAEI